jgi:hypothetical protein
MKLRMRACDFVAAAGLVVLMGASSSLHAQTAYSACGQAAGSVGLLCVSAVQAAGTAAARAGLAAAGGNPVTGAASTLGLRVRSPRLAVAARMTTTSAELHELRMLNESTQTVRMLAFGLDATIGVFDGFAAGATVGGVASLDVIASVGTVRLPEGDGFDGSVSTWALGVRAGVMRESFNAPGVTLSATFRKLGDIVYGDPQLSSTVGSVEDASPTLLSFRGVVGKRIAGLGMNGGLAYDRLSTDAHIRVTSALTPLDVDLEGFSTARTAAFVNLSWTSLIYTVAAEAGWQFGGEGPPVEFDVPNTNGKGAFFGGITLRLTF